MLGYILTYSKLQMENICQLLVLNRRDLNFCVRSALCHCGYPRTRRSNIVMTREV